LKQKGVDELDRASIYREDYVELNGVKCEICKESAYATFYDWDWENHDLCKKHLDIATDLFPRKDD
jgi:hypothetical protein